MFLKPVNWTAWPLLSVQLTSSMVLKLGWHATTYKTLTLKSLILN